MDIFAISEDELDRKVWKFRQDNSFLVLTYYSEQSRTTKRHGWKGPHWGSFDERMATLDRPKSIPEWVYMKALKSISFRVTIGWSNEQSVIAEIQNH